MKKPRYGDHLHLRYKGALLRLLCNDVTETPNHGRDSADFTIVSETQFQRGDGAHVVNGGEETMVQVVRVIVVGRRQTNIVLLRGVFPADATAQESAAGGAPL